MGLASPCRIESLTRTPADPAPCASGRGAVKYHRRMSSPTGAAVPEGTGLRERHEIPDRFKWDLTHIFPDWEGWQAAVETLDARIAAFAALQGTLGAGAAHLVKALQLRDEIGQLEYKVWYFASLW